MRNILKSAAALGLVAVIGTTLLTGVDALTADRIAAQERRVILEQLGQIIPREYDNSLLEDRIVFSDENHFPKGQLVTAYRARLNNQPVAVVLKFNAVNGYNGHIALLAGINVDGTLRGVRVISHKETPGLGDAVEVEKSNWINGFIGKSLKNPESTQWAVKRDGGSFDQFTGATITPRAVVDAVRLALEYFDTQRDHLFGTAADPSGSSAP
jgi:electron transport complex protein RnfG